MARSEVIVRERDVCDPVATLERDVIVAGADGIASHEPARGVRARPRIDTIGIAREAGCQLNPLAIEPLGRRKDRHTPDRKPLSPALAGLDVVR